MALSKRDRRIRIRKRIRKRINGTAEVPRMSIFRSNKHIYVQLIDDVSEKTIVAVSSADKGLAENKKAKKEEIAS